MKRLTKILFLLLILILCACNDTPPEIIDPVIKDPIISVTSNVARVNIKNEDIINYDFTSLFTIKEDDKEIEVLNKYIDLSSLLLKEGTYTISCTYKNKISYVDINVTEVVYRVISVVSDLPLKDEKVDSYDYSKMFRILKDSEEIEVKNDYIDLTNLRNTPGNYIVTCTYNNVSSSINVIVSKTNYEVVANEASYNINDEDIKDFDFTSCFKILKDGNEIEVKKEYVDASLVSNEEGTYNVICKFNDTIVKTKIIVYKTKYEIKCDNDVIELKLNEIKDLKLKSLFKLYREGKELTITEDLIDSNLKEEVGSYYCTLSYKDLSLTIIINVIENHKIEIVKLYKEIDLTLSEYKTYDYKDLFILYVDGKVENIKDEYLNYELKDYNVNDNFIVTCSYTYIDSSSSSSVKVNIVSDSVYKVLTKEITIYPNSEIIDLTTLFDVYKNQDKVEIDSNIISGEINYSKAGTYNITLTINDMNYVSIVKVAQGVNIDYASSDTILITKGTDINTYDFSSDFILSINGIKFNQIPKSFIDVSNVNFNELGTYVVTVNIPYNDKKLTLTGVNFSYYTKSINYQVVPLKYNLEVVNDLITIEDEKEILDNVKLKFNNLNVTLTTNKEWVSDLFVYCEYDNLINDQNIHDITLKVYVFGLDQDYVTINFKYQFKDNIEIVTINKTIYAGDTLYLTSLFKIIDNNEEVEVTNDMIYGKIDFFKVGTYNIYLCYKDHTAETTVSILDANIKGTYQTPLKTIEKTDDDGDITSASTRISNFVIDEDGSYLFDNRTISVIETINENTIKLLIGTSNYTMYYDSGIIVLNPENEFKLSFNNYIRPLVFFNTKLYKINSSFTINSLSSGYIIGETTTGYSIDCFNIQNIETGDSFIYALKVELVNKTSADSIYDVSYGYGSFNEDFNQASSKSGVFTFNNQDYNFNTLTSITGLIDRSASTLKKYSNTSFSVLMDDKLYRLSAGVNENFTFKIGSDTIFNVSNGEVTSQVNGYIDYKSDTIFIYAINHQVYGTYSYKFKVNKEDNSLIVYEKDNYYGLYYCNDNYIFLDGYNSGIFNYNGVDYSFKYEVNNYQVSLKFSDSNTFGSNVILSISDLYNVLTIKKTNNKELQALTFENSIVSIGAIIHINNFYYYGLPTSEKEELINSIDIITKDGSLSYNEKIGKISGTSTYYIVTNKIKFGTAGFYELVINIPIGDEIVSKYYAVEMLSEVYKDSTIPGSYNYGLINNNISLNLNSYGVGSVSIEDVTYKGIYTINGESILLKAYNSNGNYINLNCTIVSDGILYARCTGSASFNDYFTTGTSKIVGNDNYKLRLFTVNNNDTYIISKADNSFGNIINVKILENIYYMNYNDNEIMFMISDWNNLIDGLIEPDKYYGTYLNGEEELILDGFGKAKTNEDGKYEIIVYQGVTYFYIGLESNSFVCTLDVTNHTYTKVDIKLDNSLIINYVYTSEYSFICNDEEYLASTTFSFLDGGKVIITSTSSSHDASCTYDKYNPLFMTNEGSYSVSGNVVNVVSGGYTFSFIIENIMNPISLNTILTNYSSDGHGYFKIGTIFEKNL